MKPASIVVAVVSVGALSAGLIWPHLAGSFLRIFLTIAALALVAASTFRARLPRALASEHYSPFDSGAAVVPSAETLDGVRNLALLLKATNDPEEATRAPIPDAARRILTAQASRRLAEQHGLRLESAADHDRIRGLVSDPTWALVRPRPERGPASAISNPVPQARLESILDDLEQL